MAHLPHSESHANENLSELPFSTPRVCKTEVPKVTELVARAWDTGPRGRQRRTHCTPLGEQPATATRTAAHNPACTPGIMWARGSWERPRVPQGQGSGEGRLIPRGRPSPPPTRATPETSEGTRGAVERQQTAICTQGPTPKGRHPLLGQCLRPSRHPNGHVLPDGTRSHTKGALVHPGPKARGTATTSAGHRGHARAGRSLQALQLQPHLIRWLALRRQCP